MTNDFLRQLVTIDSDTENHKGVNKVQALIKNQLSSLGFKTQLLSNPHSKARSGKLLIGLLQGREKKSISFITHADTVHSLRSAPWRQQHGTAVASGAGSLDDKAGIVIAIQGLRTFLSQNKPHFTLKFICSPNEELGSVGFHPVFRRLTKDSLLLLGFEPALANGDTISARYGNRWYHITSKGRQAHAGRNPHDGASATHELIMKLGEVVKLSRNLSNASINVGSIDAEGKYNVVCALARARIDVRFGDIQTRDVLHKQITGILNRNYVQSQTAKQVTRTSFVIEDDCPPFPMSKASVALAKKYSALTRRLIGRHIHSRQCYGAADVNYMWKKNIAMLDGLGAEGSGMHSINESVRLTSISQRAKVLASFLELLQVADA